MANDPIDRLVNVLPRRARTGARVGKAVADIAGLSPGGKMAAAAVGALLGGATKAAPKSRTRKTTKRRAGVKTAPKRASTKRVACPVCGKAGLRMLANHKPYCRGR